jgi:hypothetical protein
MNVEAHTRHGREHNVPRRELHAERHTSQRILDLEVTEMKRLMNFPLRFS